MEMPFHLKTLPPEALDILRYFASTNENIARKEAIMEGADLNERRFGVALRRLVTKGYLAMDGYQTYRLNDSGRRVVNELSAYDAAHPVEAHSRRTRIVMRRMVMVTPRVLLSGQPTNVYVGFDEPDDEDVVEESLNLLLRLQVLNSSPDINPNKDTAMLLENKSSRQVFEIIPGAYTKIRLRCYAYQVENEEDPPEMAGGMYVDVSVTSTPQSADRSLSAYGVDVQFTVRE